MPSLIHHQFGPMADGQQVLRALGMLSAPWRWLRGRSSSLLAQKLAIAFHGDAFLFSAGREGLLALLQAIHLRQDDEVIVQAYTCIAVPNAVHAAGGHPVFVDIDPETLNLNCEEVRKAITPRTRAVLCQHTFGVPADTERLRRLCDEHRILLIEDCAHILPDETGPQEIGRHGDALLLSFGREKAISGISGGAIVCRRSDLSRKLKLAAMQAGHLRRWTVIRLLFYPLAYALTRPFYGLFIGKAILKAMQVLHLLVPVYIDDEKEGHMPHVIRTLPNALAFLALAQFTKLRGINDHRRALTRFYLEEGKKRVWLRPLAGVTPDLPLQKFPLFLEHAEEIRAILRTRNIHLHDGWTGCVICPPTVDLAITNYAPGSDPKAEQAAQRILNLPTHPGMTMKQAERLVEEIDAILNGNHFQ